MPVEHVAHLFAPLHQRLLEVLSGLRAEEWDLPTIAGAWRVRDVAAHLLDGDLRKLAAHRDGHVATEGGSPTSFGEVVTLINSLNAGGVAYAGRLSTRLLVDLLGVTGRWIADFLNDLDPFERSLFPVAWAGEAESKNWMDTGREYTERWHHQMQIRDAVGAPLLLEDYWYQPLLSFSVRALPQAYANVDASEGTAISLLVSESDLSWTLVRRSGGWSLHEGAEPNPAAAVCVTRDRAWRLFYNAYPPEEAASALSIDGDRALGLHLVRARSVMV